MDLRDGYSAGPAAGNARFEMGRVATRTFVVVRHNLAAFFVPGLIAAAPNAFLSVATTTGMVNAAHMPTAFLIATFASIFAGMVFVLMLQAAITQGTVRYLNQQPVVLGNLLAVGAREFLPLLAIGFLEILGIGLGALLLIVPAIMLAVMWSVIVPVRVVEHMGIIASFGRSAALTSGYRWPIVGVMTVYYVGSSIAQLSVRPAIGAAMSIGLTWAYIGIDTVINAVVGVIAAAGVACIYYELRMIKEGWGPEQVAAVFA